MKKILHSIAPRLLALMLLLSVFAPAKTHAQGTTSLGTDFWVAFMPDYLYPAENIRLFIGSGTANKVKVEWYGGTNPPAKTDGFSMTANSVHTLFNLSTSGAETRQQEFADYRGVHITSQNPICVYGFSNVTATSDGFLALPTNSLGTKYYAACYYDDNYGFSPPLAGEFVVVAPYDNTNVTITTRADTRSDPSGTLSHKAGDTWTVSLMRGQTYLVQSTGLLVGEGDLTGSLISSDKPVGLMSGHQRATIPIGGMGAGGIVNSKDLLIEMIPPVDKWGTQYYDMPMAYRTQCGDYIRLIAGEEGVIISENGNIIASLDHAGDWVDREIVLEPTVYKSVNGKHFLCVQYAYSQGYLNDPSDADPFEIVMTPEEQFQKQIIFRTPNNLTAQPDFKHFATFICRADSIRQLTINGQKLGAFGASYFNFPGTANPAMAAARIQLPTSNTTFVANCGAKFGLYLYGFTNVDGYGWPAGMALKIISPDTLPPLDSAKVQCGDWDVTLFETRHMPKFSFEDTRISDVAMITDLNDSRWKTPSFNYEFALNPNFVVGDSVTTVKLKVLDKTKDAYAAVWTTDKAGNDTVYEFRWTAPKLKLSPQANPYVFGPQLVDGPQTCQTLMITNKQAEGDLILGQASIVGSAKGGQFTVNPANLNKTLHPGDSTPVTVCFVASDTVQSLDTLLITTTCVPFPFALLGVGATPLIEAEDLNFGILDSGTTKCLTLKVFNRGNWKLVISSEDLATSNPNFSIDPAQTFPITILPGEFVTVRFCFTATATGSFQTTLNWLANLPKKFEHQIKDKSTLKAKVVRPGAKLSLFEQDFKEVHCGVKPLILDTLFNDQTKPELIDSVRIHGPGAAWYSFNTTLGSSQLDNFVLDTRANGQIGIIYNIEFNPDAVPTKLDSGTRFAQVIAFTTNAQTKLLDSTIITNLYGKRKAPTLALDQAGQTISLGTMRIGSTLTGRAVIRNSGNDVLSVTGLQQTGANSSDFTVTPPPPYSINPSDSQVVTITFTTNKEEDATATFTTVTTSCTNNQLITYIASAVSSSNTAHGAFFNTMWTCDPKQLPAQYINLSTRGSGQDDVLDSVAIIGGGGSFILGPYTKFQTVLAGDTAFIPVNLIPTKDGAQDARIRFYYMHLDIDGTPVFDSLERDLKGLSETLPRIAGLGSTTTPVTYHLVSSQALQIPIQMDVPFGGTRASVWGYTFTLSWHRDLFNFSNLTIGGSAVQPVGPATYDAATDLESRTFSFMGGKMTNQNILGDLTLETRISSKVTSDITISNASFLDSNGKPACYVNTQLVNATFNLDDECGYKTIRSLLSGNGIPLDITAISPNPASTVSNVNFEVRQDKANVTVSLYDALGAEVARPMNAQELRAGEYQVSFKADRLGSGTYYVRISDGKNVSTKQLMIQK